MLAKLNPLRRLVARGAGAYLRFLVLSGWEPLTPPVRDTNPSQVSSQQTLVLIYLPRKDGKQSWLRRKRRLYKYSNLGRVEDRTGDLVVRKQRSYQLCQPLQYSTVKNFFKTQSSTAQLILPITSMNLYCVYK